MLEYDANGEHINPNKVDEELVKTTNDKLDRVKTIETPIATAEYNYLQNGDHATNLPNLVTQKLKDGTTNRTRYIYDANGNIVEIRDRFNCLVARFAYDQLNRLVKENNKEIGYCTNGNPIYTNVDGKITEYTYDGDKLLSFNGELCGNYDSLGNPWLYRNKALEWDFRSLTKYQNVSFAYNAFGLRTSKTQANKHTEYTWSTDGRLLTETRKTTQCDLQVGGVIPEGGCHIYATEDIIEYTHASNGIAGFSLNNTQYWFLKNLFGDVTHIFDTNNQCVAQYTYDAWGNHVVQYPDGTENNDPNFIGNINPIRYRGYYWDDSVKLYYLKSRYYDPETGRFINADAIDILDEAQHFINGLNLYAYCGNNPIMRTDESGEKWWKWLVGGLALIGGTILTITGVGAIAGVGLMVAGGSMLASSTMAVAGLDSKLSSIIISGLNVIGGVGLMFVPGLQGLGASMIGSGVGSIAGGYISEAFGGSFALGSMIGGIVGSVAGGYIHQGLTTTKLYRTIGSAEAESLSSSGKFSTISGQMEGKFFATSRANAAQWGSKFGSNNIVVVRVSKSALTHQSVNYFNYGLDGIGKAYYFSDMSYLNLIAKILRLF